MNENQAIIRYNKMISAMVQKFLAWKLPEDFSPDAGISFEPEYNKEYMAKLGLPPSKHEPVGTNLFSAQQAEEMFKACIPPSCFGDDDCSSQALSVCKFSKNCGD